MMTQLERLVSDPIIVRPTFATLPDEILELILKRLPARCLLTLGQVSKRLSVLADGHAFWRVLCIEDFKFWDARHEYRSRLLDPTFQSWKALYKSRSVANNAARLAIKTIINVPVSRLVHISDVIARGYGVKDELLRLARPIPRSKNELADRYWAQIVLGCVNRRFALETWTQINERADISNAIELIVSCLDMFVLGSSAEGDISDTMNRLDQYVNSMKEAHPDLVSQQPRSRAIIIAEHLRSKGWVGIDQERNYYDLRNMFLGVSLRTEHHSALPLISSIIYSYVCRAFGLQAGPCGFPMHVHTVIRPAACEPSNLDLDLDGQPLPWNHNLDQISDRTHLYMDVFNKSEPVSISALREQLVFGHRFSSIQDQDRVLRPSTPKELLLRTAHNIISSVQHQPFPVSSMEDINVSIYDAAYGALFALVLFPLNRQTLTSSLHDIRSHFANHYPHDLYNYKNYVVPLTSSIAAQGVTRFGGMALGTDPLIRTIEVSDQTPSKPKFRHEKVKIGQQKYQIKQHVMQRAEGEETKNEVVRSWIQEEVKFHVGDVFRHRRQGYLGVIYGWDEKCDMDERWIVGNNVDRLENGRGQPFYNSFVNDGSTRYVAQQNVVLLTPENFKYEDVDKNFGYEIGRWFKRFDPETCKFVSNIEDEYPEN